MHVFYFDNLHLMIICGIRRYINALRKSDAKNHGLSKLSHMAIVSSAV